MSIELFAYAAIGGLGAPAGAVLGVLGFRAVDYGLAEWFSGDIAAILRLSLSGTGLLVVLYLLPGGLWQGVQGARDRIVARLVPAAASGLDGGDPSHNGTAPADERDALAGALRDGEGSA
jgi:hypothetical protein